MIKFIVSLLILFLFSLNSSAVEKRRKVPALPAKPIIEKNFSSPSLERVDPHGLNHESPTPQIAESQNNCKVCHFFENKIFKTKTNTVTSCALCHNAFPHSGVEEHQRHGVSCLDCHVVHRGKAIVWNSSESTLFKKLPTKELAPGLVFKKTNSAMLKKDCTECHKF